MAKNRNRRRVEIVHQMTTSPRRPKPRKSIARRIPQDGSGPTAQDLARAVVQPVEVTYLEKPKRLIKSYGLDKFGPGLGEIAKPITVRRVGIWY